MANLTEAEKENILTYLHDKKRRSQGRYKGLRKGDVSKRIRAEIELMKKMSKSSRVNWRDTEEVINRACEYLECCEQADIYPSMIGLASNGFGVCRRSMYDWINAHPEHPTSQYINLISEHICDILVDLGNKSKGNPASIIFQLKNHHGHRDVIHTHTETTPVLGNLEDKQDQLIEYIEKLGIEESTQKDE